MRLLHPLQHLAHWITHRYSHGGSKTRLEHLDGWRGIAISIVLLSHFGPVTQLLPFDRVLLGRLGVDFFFVLSGFLMANILFVKRTPLSIFYKRRVSRIFPVFLFYVVAIYGYGWLFTDAEETKNFLSTLTFMRGYFPLEQDIWRVDLPVSNLWSLNVEEHSYVLLSLLTLIAAFHKREYLPLLALGFAAITIHYLYIRYPHIAIGRYSVRTETAMSHLMISAGYFMLCRKISIRPPGWVVLAVLIGGVWSYTRHAPWFASWLLAPFLLSFAVNHAHRLPRPILGLLRFGPLRLLGIWSYSIYLWQQPYYIWHKHGGWSFSGSAMLLFLLALFTGVVSFNILENPVRRWLNRHW
ncbi:MAG: acyltransferase [Silicimonas sp.]|nr:acyltransferase [Silicimonas sp.]